MKDHLEVCSDPSFEEKLRLITSFGMSTFPIITYKQLVIIVFAGAEDFYQNCQ
jgi:hypothetical protein